MSISAVSPSKQVISIVQKCCEGLDYEDRIQTINSDTNNDNIVDVTYATNIQKSADGMIDNFE